MHTMEDLYDQICRMKRADMPLAECGPLAYSNACSLAIQDMGKLSGKQIGLLMEALFAAYQLGRNRVWTKTATK